jgi:hypothetical protein
MGKTLQSQFITSKDSFRWKWSYNDMLNDNFLEICPIRYFSLVLFLRSIDLINPILIDL